MIVRNLFSFCVFLVQYFLIATSTDYRVDVTTVDNNGRSGKPNGITYIILTGSGGALRRTKLPTGVRKASLDTLTISGARNIGEICNVKIESLSADAWFIGTVFIRIDDRDNRTQLFTFNQWIQKDSIITRYHKVHGGWGAWTDWTSCRAECEKKGTQSRRRKCNRPPAGCDGTECAGDNVQRQSCTGECDSPRTGETLGAGSLLPWIIAVSICAGLLFILIIVVVALCCVFCRRNKETPEESPYSTTRSQDGMISIVSSDSMLSNSKRSHHLIKKEETLTYAQPRGGRDSTMSTNNRTNRNSEVDRNLNEQNNCVDYVYYTYNYNKKNKDSNGNAPRIVPCDGKTGKPVGWEVNDMYETNITVF